MPPGAIWHGTAASDAGPETPDHTRPPESATCCNLRKSCESFPAVSMSYGHAQHPVFYMVPCLNSTPLHMMSLKASAVLSRASKQMEYQVGWLCARKDVDSCTDLNQEGAWRIWKGDLPGLAIVTVQARRAPPPEQLGEICWATIGVSRADSSGPSLVPAQQARLGL